MFKQLASIALVLVSVALAAPSIANDRAGDFDQSVDVSKILQNIKDSVGNEQLEPVTGRSALMPTADQIETEIRSRAGETKNLAGSIFGPFQPRVLQSQPYQTGQGLLDPISKLPSAVQAPLHEQWSSIDRARTDLLKTAKNLDRDDSKLFDDGAALDNEAANLRRQLDSFNADVERYNQQCAGQPTNATCDAWYARLQKQKAALSQAISKHNDAVDGWNTRYRNLSVKADEQNQNVDKWEAMINTFIANAKAALECRSLDHLDIQPTQDRVPTGGIELPIEAKPVFANQPAGTPACPVDFIWTMTTKPDVPNTVIGTLSANGKTATFRSGNFTGLATVVCQDKNSGKGTASLLTIYHSTR